MGKERITFEQIIELLRDSQHKAPNGWAQLESALDLDHSISQLPQHKAPDSIWTGIENELDATASKKSSTRLNGLYILLAAILFLISTLILVNYFLEDEQEDSYQYRSEVEMASLDESAVRLDDNIDDVLIYIENNSFMFSDEQLQEFNTQLIDINAALAKLMDMQEKYGIDDSSNKMMARMERDKANLLKSMITNS